MIFIKDDLLVKNYHWNEADENNTLANGPTRKRFDRLSGNCLLRMINLFDLFVARLTIPQGQKIESMIREHLPDDAKSEVSVFNWLRGKYVYNDLEAV